MFLSISFEFEIAPLCPLFGREGGCSDATLALCAIVYVFWHSTPSYGLSLHFSISTFVPNFYELFQQMRAAKM